MNVRPPAAGLRAVPASGGQATPTDADHATMALHVEMGRPFMVPKCLGGGVVRGPYRLTEVWAPPAPAYTGAASTPTMTSGVQEVAAHHCCARGDQLHPARYRTC